MIMNHENRWSDNLLDRLQSSPILPKVPVLFLPVAFLLLVWVFAQPAPKEVCFMLYEKVSALLNSDSKIQIMKLHFVFLQSLAKHQYLSAKCC